MTTESKAKSAVILSQLGGRRFIMMVGATNLSYDSNKPYANLSFRFKGSHKANYCKIELDWNDTYIVTFGRVGKKGYKEISEHVGIYNDMLQELFTSETGLYTTLGTMGG